MAAANTIQGWRLPIRLPALAFLRPARPTRRRQLSLNIPIITGARPWTNALSCSPNGYTSMHSTMSPFSKTTLDINKLYVQHHSQQNP
ncbi:ras-specific guanine nucleotide-releasing factor 1-like protein [Lates japonicus]|uniref:Ras-specific guanine nucleotide-releasing factor 1-like protein n=1 Tax=Lates japonicus TaxID=270547 RepID=A0AAD3MR65_LATJO|nr:ras-specific guanine nucleotide-releasing factor 1-like protein [Lates japonicus]